MNISRIVIALALVTVLSAGALAQKVDDYVMDDVGVFSAAQKQATISLLKDLEQQTSVQFVIYVTGNIPEGYDLESYSLKIAEENGIGQAGHDNGLLFFLAVEDRQYRWEVGYGIEDVLNTPLLGRLSREHLVPAFQEGDYAGGIMKGIDVVSRILLNSTDDDIMALKSPPVSDNQRLISFIPLIILVIFSLISILTRRFGKRRLGDDAYIAGSSMIFFGGFGRGRGGFGGGGFSGGGGGFGGGGFSGGF